MQQKGQKIVYNLTIVLFEHYICEHKFIYK